MVLVHLTSRRSPRTQGAGIDVDRAKFWCSGVAVGGLPARVGACLGQCSPLAVARTVGSCRGCGRFQPTRQTVRWPLTGSRADRRPRSELGRTGHFSRTQKRDHAHRRALGPWRAHEESCYAPFSILIFSSPKPRFYFLRLRAALVLEMASLSKFSSNESNFIAKVGSKKPSGAQPDSE
jgi:hypothetical protein